MIDANDAMMIDWTNPTAHMLAGRDAGLSVYEEQVSELQAENQRLRARPSWLCAACAAQWDAAQAAKGKG